MKSLVISCNTIRAEVNQAVCRTGFDGAVLYLESGLHNDPQKLSTELQKTLDRIAFIDQVLLVMGYCGNAVLGLRPQGFRLIVPKADDCITMLLGSQEKRKETQEEKYTYFLSKGWLDYFDDMEGPLMRELERMTDRYGLERALRVFRLTFKHYQRLGVIDTGTFDVDDLLRKADKQAELMQLPCEVIPGTMNFLETFLTGPWENNRFIKVESGETLQYEHLYG